MEEGAKTKYGDSLLPEATVGERRENRAALEGGELCPPLTALPQRGYR